MAAVLLRLLGPASLVQDGDTTPVPRNTPASLLLYLAAAGDWVSRRELAYLYKPDSSEQGALAYLRLQLHRAGQYPWADGLEVAAHQVRWPVASDLSELRRAHKEQRWADAVNAYNGRFLQGLDGSDWATYESWLELEREAVASLYRTALHSHAEELTAAGEHRAAFNARCALLGEDELDEAALRAVLRAAPAAGQASEAMRLFARFEKLVAAEFDLTPAAETVALAAQLRDSGAAASGRTGAPTGPATAAAEPTAADPAVVPVGGSTAGPASVARARPSLPQATTRFIGRDAELAELSELLANPECRLVSVVGLGGSGKTRLALEVARRRQRHFAAGALFVPLVDAEDAAQALLRLATALEVDAPTEAGLEEAVAGRLRDQEVLLVLDNVEQVEGLAEVLARLLAATLHVKVLATSRKRIGLASEWLFDLTGLGVGAGGEATPDSDAAQLFLSAAKRVQPRLRFSKTDLQAVARICRHVDGLPLALELAAAWVRAMPVGQVAEEISRGFDLLSADLVDLAERHRSVETVLARTWEGLTEHQARTLAGMTVFHDGCTLDAAVTVTQGQLPILLSLVNQSLLYRDAAGRFGIHPLVGQYAARVLATDSDWWRFAHDAHAQHYAAFLERFAPADKGGAAPSLRELEPEMANVEKAWFHLVDQRRTDRLAELVDALLGYYTILGQYRRGVELGTETLARLTSDEPLAVHVRWSVLLALSTMARESGLLAQALTYAERAAAAAEAGGQVGMQARARRFGADVLQMLGRYDEAEAAYEVAVAAFTELAEKSELANTLNSLASMDAVRERYDAATRRFERCVTLFEEVGDVLAKAIALNNLGYLADAMGRQSLAAQHYEASLADFERIQFTRGIAAIKNNLVVLYGTMGRLDEAEAMGEQSLALKVEMEDRLGIVISLKNLGDLSLMRGEPERALERYLPAIRLALETEATPRLLQVLPGYADALRRCGDDAQADATWRALAVHPLTPPSAREKALATLTLEEWSEDAAPLTALLESLRARLDTLPAAY